MKIKGRGILVVCLILFGGGALYDYYSMQKEADKKIQESRVMTLSLEQVHKVEITKAPEPAIVLTRGVDGWKLESPIRDWADAQVADSFLSEIYPERILEVAKEGDSINWTEYGLNPPAATITLTDAAGVQNVFHISSKKNFEENIFARKDSENRVLVLTPAWEHRSNKTVLDFRDRRVLRKNIASVDELAIKNDKGSFILRRVDGKWQTPTATVGLDQNKVRKFLSELADAKADQIFENQKIPAGLKPLMRLDLKLAGHKWSAQVSQSQVDRKIYAAITEPSFLLRLEAGALDELVKKELKSLEVENEKEGNK